MSTPPAKDVRESNASRESNACHEARAKYKRMLELAHYSKWDEMPLVTPRELDQLRLAMNDACATRVRRFQVRF